MIAFLYTFYKLLKKEKIMPKLTEKTKKMREQQELLDQQAAAKINDVIIFVHDKVLHGFIPITFLRSMIAIILLILKFSVKRTATLSGFKASSTIRDKQRKYDNGAIAEIFSRKEGSGRTSACDSVQDEIIKELETHDYRSVKHIQSMIQEKIKNAISISAVKEFLHRLGFKWLKCGSLPSKADPEKQRKFYEEKERPLMERAKKGEVVLCFVDAAHFVMGNTHLGNIWCRIRRFIKTFSGRIRYNVLGALNFVTKKMTTVTNAEYITAPQVIELLDKLANEYARLPIYLILDNAKYQSCRIVREHAKSLGIELVFLPSYSPNLNLIERFWKYLKKELGVGFFEVFDDFCKNIDIICESAHTENKSDMDTLIGEKVQLFDHITQKSDKSVELTPKVA